MTENDKATAIQIIYSDTTHISRVCAVSPLRQEAKDDRHITCEYARMIRRLYYDYRAKPKLQISSEILNDLQ